jgi:hypothetical protein
MEIDMLQTNEKLVVNCLFNSNKDWELLLSRTKRLDEKNVDFIENATVEIFAEGEETIQLNHDKNGIYRANSKPQVGKTYTLKVNVEGYEELSAQGTIPPTIQAEIEDFEINWLKYLFPNDLLDYDVFPLTVNFEKTVEQAHFFFRAHSFIPEFGYNRYMLASSSLEKMEAEGLPQEVAKQLEEIADVWQVNSYMFTDCLTPIAARPDYINYYNMIENSLKKKKVSNREYEAFQHSECFADDAWLNNISEDTYTVFGEGGNARSAQLLYSESNLFYEMQSGHNLTKEYWLEVSQVDPNYFEYYKAYILQINQRGNPYSGPVKAYTNITNGVGIFAGFNRQMIHLFNN